MVSRVGGIIVVFEVVSCVLLFGAKKPVILPLFRVLSGIVAGMLCIGVKGDCPFEV